MSSRTFRVGMAGTFDVENFGDLLFPLIARKELEQRLGQVELLAFSYRQKTAAEWPFPVHPVTELPHLAHGLDAMLLGGGFLVRFDKAVASGYLPPSPEIHHPTGFWLSPALICLQHGVPVVWNTPGAYRDGLPAWAGPLLALALSQSSYIAVRDEPSRDVLADFVERHRFELVPDTAFGLARWLPEAPSFELNRLRDANGLGGRYIVIQGQGGLEACCEFLKRHAGRLQGYRFLALEMGPINGDDAALVDAGLPGLVRLPAWPAPWLLAELIRHASAVIGPSYHLAVAALTAGVPVFTQAQLHAGKFAGLTQFSDTIHPLPATPERDADWFLSRLERSPVSPPVLGAIDRLAAHWDRVAEVVRGGAAESAPAVTAVGRFWQSLPGILEGHAVQADLLASAAVAAERADAAHQAAEMSRRNAELSRLLAMARGEIARRDDRIAQLLGSTSWRLTAPMRFIGRRLGRGNF